MLYWNILLFILQLFIPLSDSSENALAIGLVAHYSFNQCNAIDDTGQNPPGKTYGSVSCWCGVDDDGLLFDGVHDYVEFPGPVNQSFSTTDFTVSFYIKPEQYLIFQQSLIGKRMDCTEVQMLDFALDLHQEQVAIYFHETEKKYHAYLAPPVSSNGWFHVALVREGTRAFSYINGQLQKESFRCSGVDISNEANLMFSNSPCVDQGRMRRFKGVLDELRVYDRALSDEEVKALYELFPIENLQMDCVTFAPEKRAPCLEIPLESTYLYSV